MGLSWTGDEDPVAKQARTGFCEEHGVYHVSGEAHSCEAWEAWQNQQRKPVLITLVNSVNVTIAVWTAGMFSDWIANRLYDMPNSEDPRYPYRLFVGGPIASQIYRVAPGNLAVEVYLLLYANNLL